MNSKKRILVAPLNWGLGHATRCIPIINALIENDFEPILASDGDALAMLKKEFPRLTCLELPSYGIRYSKKASHFKLRILMDSPSIIKAIKNEKEVTAKIIKAYDIIGSISDNRFGVRNKQIPSVFITHQLNVLSGSTSWLSSKLHQGSISKFDECWVPDTEETPNLSGRLGHLDNSSLITKYIGPLSRFEKKEFDPVYDLMILLSGPEPQRTILENRLFAELKGFHGRVIFVQGKVEKKQSCSKNGNITIYNFMNTTELEIAINQSGLLICRSGYTTIMDLFKLEKKAFFIPTPGQFEQEYLANRLKEAGIAPFCTQKQFSIDKLTEVKDYNGFRAINNTMDLGDLFDLFQCE
jgi:uncharacterized protein (TIGR00661 family)